jgi:hypothetical protein
MHLPKDKIIHYLFIHTIIKLAMNNQKIILIFINVILSVLYNISLFNNAWSLSSLLIVST